MLSESYRSFRKVYLAVGYTDLRKGIQGLSQLVGIKFDINSASERAAKTFVIGRKNWMLINSIKWQRQVLQYIQSVRRPKPTT